MKIKKLTSLILGSLIAVTVLSGCGASKAASSGNSSSSGKKETIKIGISGSDDDIWKNVKERLVKENVDLQIVSFSDYIRPNMALSDGDIDANAFQTVAYFNQFKSDHHLDLTSLGYTCLAPMGVYSSNLKSIKDLKDGSKIAIPNDATNGGRALLLLQDAKLLTLKKGSGITPTVKDIAENPKNLKIIPMVATQIPRSIKDVDAAAINNGVAVDAGYSPLKDSILIEDSKKPSAKNYYNIIAVRTKDKNKSALKKLLKVYQTEETKKLIKKRYNGAQIPVF